MAKEIKIDLPPLVKEKIISVDEAREILNSMFSEVELGVRLKKREEK